MTKTLIALSTVFAIAAAIIVTEVRIVQTEDDCAMHTWTVERVAGTLVCIGE